MRRRNLLAAGLAIIASAVALPTIGHAQQVKLRYAHVGSEGDIQYWYAEQAAKKIPEVTGGRVTVQVFPNSQLGGVQEMIDGVKSGAISRTSRSSTPRSCTGTALTRSRRRIRANRRCFRSSIRN
jgi:TRAP-type C4-dicarboxylate transport system substrate-binding protein